jgi:hypothetical protein
MQASNYMIVEVGVWQSGTQTPVTANVHTLAIPMVLCSHGPSAHKESSSINNDILFLFILLLCDLKFIFSYSLTIKSAQHQSNYDCFINCLIMINHSALKYKTSPLWVLTIYTEKWDYFNW